MRGQEIVISILGSGGGVAKAVLALLNQSVADPLDPIHSLMTQSTIHLIDWRQKDIEHYKQIAPNLINRIVLHEFDLKDMKRVRRHLSDTATLLVIDVSWADTVDMLACCNDFGISYVNTALEIIAVDENEDLEGFTLIERYKIFENARNRFTNMKGILCSGMNPGVVQWMAHAMMGESPGLLPLACFIVETDSTFFKDRSLVRPKTVYSSWSPECYLDEAILNYPMFVKNKVPLHLYSPPYRQEFKVTLGDMQFYGTLMPHEEVLAIGQRHDMEVGFLYKVNDYMTQQIRNNLHQMDILWDWNHKVFDPSEAEIEGEDLVGVLLVYKDKEKFMYNVMNNQFIFNTYGTNATYLQVACGVYGAVCTLLLDDTPKGIYFVNELLETVKSTGYGKYVTQYMTDFVQGENAHSDGLLLDRIKKI